MVLLYRDFPVSIRMAWVCSYCYLFFELVYFVVTPPIDIVYALHTLRSRCDRSSCCLVLFHLIPVIIELFPSSLLLLIIIFFFFFFITTVLLSLVLFIIILLLLINKFIIFVFLAFFFFSSSSFFLLSFCDCDLASTNNPHNLHALVSHACRGHC